MCFPRFVFEGINSVFENLISDILLSKCMYGGKPNCNVNLDSIIWSKCPKAIFAGRKRLEISVYDSVIVYNERESVRLPKCVSLECFKVCFQHSWQKVDVSSWKWMNEQDKTVWLKSITYTRIKLPSRSILGVVYLLACVIKALKCRFLTFFSLSDVISWILFDVFYWNFEYLLKNVLQGTK
jgi:hypothetical protein